MFLAFDSWHLQIPLIQCLENKFAGTYIIRQLILAPTFAPGKKLCAWKLNQDEELASWRMPMHREEFVFLAHAHVPGGHAPGR